MSKFHLSRWRRRNVDGNPPRLVRRQHLGLHRFGFIRLNDGRVSLNWKIEFGQRPPHA
jgi:hypothetical protein